MIEHAVLVPAGHVTCVCGPQEGWIREKEQILSSEDHGKDLTGALRLLSQHKALEDEMSGRAGPLQQTVRQGEELVANQHFGADKIKERIQDVQVLHVPRPSSQDQVWLLLTPPSLLLLQAQWAELERLSALRKSRLQEACNKHQFQVKPSSSSSSSALPSSTCCTWPASACV